MKRAALRVIALTLALASFGAAAGLAQSEVAAREAAAALAARADRDAAAGDLDAAVRALEEAARAAPRWAELKVNLAAMKSRAGDYAGAIAAARAALALDPSLDGARFNLGLAQFKSGDPERASATLDPYRGDATAPLAVHVALGLSDAALDRFAPAAASLEHAVAAGLRAPGVLYTLGRTWVKLGNLARARKIEELLASTAPGSAEQQMLAGDLADASNDWVAAEAAYRRVLEVNETFPGGRFALGLMLFKRRAYDAAAREFERVLQREPLYTPALYFLALLELDRARAAAAVPLLERLTRASPRSVDGWRDLGRAYLELDRATDAVTALRAAVDGDPESAPARFLLARALARAGRDAEAREQLRAATALNRKTRAELEARISGDTTKQR